MKIDYAADAAPGQGLGQGLVRGQGQGLSLVRGQGPGLGLVKGQGLGLGQGAGSAPIRRGQIAFTTGTLGKNANRASFPATFCVLPPYLFTFLSILPHPI